MLTLIYDNSLEGHHLEYIHHIYIKALSVPYVSFIFVVPFHFLEKSKLMKWPDSTNIKFDYIPDEYAAKTLHSRFHSIGMQFQNAKLIAKYIKKYSPDHFFTPGGMPGYPFVDLFISRHCKTKISSVCYSILPYYYKNLPLFKKLIEWYTYNVVVKRNYSNKIFLLNNKKYLSYYENKYGIDKFRYLTDPVTTDKSIGKNFREELNIPRDKRLFIHVGAMDYVKGTINLLKAIKLLSQDELKKNHFIFAGRVGSGIKTEFYELISEINCPESISVYDEFCEYEFFCSLYKSCDYVLFPYPPRPNSSGLLGNAALFGKPVITTSGGATGDLVSEYNLGVLMDDNSTESILNAIRNESDIDITPYKYVAEHTIEEFCNQIFDVITK